MAQYSPKTWVTGELITAAELNAIEAAAAAAAVKTDTDAAITAASTADRARANHTGTQSADTITDGTTNKAYTATEKTKLAGVATGATAYTDAQAQAANVTALAAKATIADFGVAGTPTGDAGRAAIDARTIVWRPIGTGGAPPTSNGLTGVGTNTGGTGVKRCHTAVAVTALKIRWGNFTVGSQESSASYPDLTIVAASVEYPSGTFTPVFFNGNTGTVIKAGGIADSDSVSIVIPANTDYWVRTFATWSGTSVALANLYNPVAGQSGNLAASPVDKTQTAGSAGGDSYGVAPVAILGRVLATTKAVLAVGDSIANGTGDFPDQNRGYIDIAFEGVVPSQKITSPTGRAMYEATSAGRWRKARLADGLTSAYEAYGVNDVMNGQSVAQVQTSKIALWSWLSSIPGMTRVYTATLLPQTIVSTDGWGTASGQSVNNTTLENNRVSVNNWIRDGAPVASAANLTAVAVGTSGALRAGQVGHPLAGYVELADVVEADATNTLTRNGGRWRVVTSGLRNVADAAITSGAKVLTSATAVFTSADVGTVVTVAGAGSAGGLLVASIAAMTNATTVTLSVTAGTTVTGAALRIGGPTADGIHPTTNSHQLLASVLAAAIPTLTA